VDFHPGLEKVKYMYEYHCCIDRMRGEDIVLCHLGENTTNGHTECSSDRCTGREGREGDGAHTGRREGMCKDAELKGRT
jgi:hypothetical protein